MIYTKHGSSYLEEPAACYSIPKNHKYWTALRHYACTLATEAPPAINLPSSRKFSCPLMITNLLSHVQLFSLALFCLDTNSSHAHGQQ